MVDRATETEGLESARRELEEANAALARREEMLRQAEAISGFGSWEWDVASDEVHWSDQMFRIYGLDKHSFVLTPEKVRDLYHPDDREYARSVVHAAVTTRQPFQFEYRIVRPSGEIRVLHSFGRPESSDPDRFRLFGVVQDITERKETEKVLADALSRERIARVGAERANAELESFVYTVSHDLNGPVISVLGYVDLFETDFGATLPDEAKFYLERIKASGIFMQSLISDLLELSRIGRVQTEPEMVDLEELILKLVEESRSAIDDVAVEIAGDMPPVHMNPARARQLFGNLMKNSVDHSGRSDVRIAVTAEEENDLVSISFSDNGPGIPADKRDRVFGVFERLDVSHGGTGMGLAICKRIVETIGGQIWIVDSDAGTDVRVSLPRWRGEA